MVGAFFSINKNCYKNGKLLNEIVLEDYSGYNPNAKDSSILQKNLAKVYVDDGNHGFSISNIENRNETVRRSTLNTHSNHVHIRPYSHFNMLARKEHLLLKSYIIDKPRPEKKEEAYIVPSSKYISKNPNFSMVIETHFKPYLKGEEEIPEDPTEILNINETADKVIAGDVTTTSLLSFIEEKGNFYVPKRMRKIFYNSLVIEEGKIDTQYQEKNLKDARIVTQNLMDNIHNSPIVEDHSGKDKEKVNLRKAIPNFFNALEHSPGPKVSNGIKYSWSDTSLAKVTSQANERGITIEKAIFEQIGIVKFFKLYYDIDLDTVDYGEINREVLEAKCNWIFTNGPVWLQQGMHHFWGRYPLDRALSHLSYSQKSIEMEPERAVSEDIFVRMPIIPFERNALIFRKDNIWIKTKQDTKEEIIAKRYPNKIILPIEEIEKEMPGQRKKLLEIEWKKEIEE
jgi:hypothetical protein